jgi:hypothetical protein
VLELSLQVPDLMPNQYFLYVWLGRTSNVGGYDVVDANVGLPAFVVKPLAEHVSRGGLVSLAYQAKKSGTLKQDVAANVG